MRMEKPFSSTDPAQTRHDRRVAIATGVFFIIATAFLFIGEAIYKPVLTAPDFLETVAVQKPRVLFGLLIEFLCILAMPMIAISIYPVLRRANEGVAMAYVFFRSLEAFVLIGVALVNKLSLIGLSQAYLDGGSADRAGFEMLITGWDARTYWADTAGPLYNLVFILGALTLYVALYRTRLIPRFLSGWGIAAAIALCGAVLASVFVDIPDIWVVGLILPIAVQEMAMALWFILKGFDRAALVALDDHHARPAGRDGS